MKIIFDYNRTIFDPEKGQLYPGVLKLLSKLSKSHNLFLVSMKEAGRKDRINKLRIFFNQVFFVDKKTVEVFRKIGGTKGGAVVVGDRVRKEIKIGNELNYITVWLKQGKFSSEFPVNKFQKPDYTINSILELKTIIKKYE